MSLFETLLFWDPMINGKELAKILGISKQAVDLARQDGRITPAEKKGNQYFYDPDRAAHEYVTNTRQPKSEIGKKSHIVPMLGFEDDPDDSTEYWIDKNPKTWKINQAQTAKAIFDAQIKRLEYEAQSKNYLPAKDVERELLRIVTEFSRAMVGFPSKLKQKIDKLEDSDLEIIKEICSDIISNCEHKL